MMDNGPRIGEGGIFIERPARCKCLLDNMVLKLRTKGESRTSSLKRC
jgi:hypothetical protein